MQEGRDVYLHEKSRFYVDRVADCFGLVPAAFINTGTKMLKPLQNYRGPYVALMDRMDDGNFVEGWQRMDRWINDGIPFPGETYRQWIRDFYKDFLE